MTQPEQQAQELIEKFTKVIWDSGNSVGKPMIALNNPSWQIKLNWDGDEGFEKAIVDGVRCLCDRYREALQEIDKISFHKNEWVEMGEVNKIASAALTQQ